LSAQVVAALVSGVVAIVIAATSSVLTWNQVRRERRKWLVDAKVAIALELYKTRISSYPLLLEVIEPLSTRNRDHMTPEAAGKVAMQLNQWLYSTGGACADAKVRGALLGLRQCCDRWQGGGAQPTELYEFRNLLIAFLRRDLDVASDLIPPRPRVPLCGTPHRSAGVAGRPADTPTHGITSPALSSKGRRLGWADCGPHEVAGRSAGDPEEPPTRYARRWRRGNENLI